MRGGNFVFLGIFRKNYKGSPLRQIIKIKENDKNTYKRVSAPPQFNFYGYFHGHTYEFRSKIMTITGAEFRILYGPKTQYPGGSLSVQYILLE